jgi:serine/threonine protein kinase
LSDIHATLQAALADRYVLGRELGRGGMATVYLAQDLKRDRPVAVKVLHPEIAASPCPKRFLREIGLPTGVPPFKPGSPRQIITLLEARPLATGGVILRYAAKPRDA